MSQPKKATLELIKSTEGLVLNYIRGENSKIEEANPENAVCLAFLEFLASTKVTADNIVHLLPLKLDVFRTSVVNAMEKTDYRPSGKITVTGFMGETITLKISRVTQFFARTGDGTCRNNLFAVSKDLLAIRGDVVPEVEEAVFKELDRLSNDLSICFSAAKEEAISLARSTIVMNQVEMSRMTENGELVARQCAARIKNERDSTFTKVLLDKVVTMVQSDGSNGDLERHPHYFLFVSEKVDKKTAVGSESFFHLTIPVEKDIGEFMRGGMFSDGMMLDIFCKVVIKDVGTKEQMYHIVEGPNCNLTTKSDYDSTIVASLSDEDDNVEFTNVLRLIGEMVAKSIFSSKALCTQFNASMAIMRPIMSGGTMDDIVFDKTFSSSGVPMILQTFIKRRYMPSFIAAKFSMGATTLTLKHSNSADVTVGSMAHWNALGRKCQNIIDVV